MKRASLVIVLTLSLAAVAFAASQASASAPDRVSTVVTVINHRSGPMPAIARDDVIVHQDGKVRPVLSWEPLTGSHAGVDLAVLIDDSLSTNIALHWDSVKAFVRKLPPGSRVATVYGASGSADFAQHFTTDREEAMKALRLPRGEISEGASIYESLESLIKHWPNDHNRRVVLLISDGIDLTFGIAQSNPGLNTNLQNAINDAQRKGVTVDSIFASGASEISHNAYLIANGQGSLSRLALETGGRSFTLGFQTPINIAPFLDQIATGLAHQYQLTFRAKLGRKAGFARLRLRCEQHGVELLAPSRVYLPAAE